MPNHGDERNTHQWQQVETTDFQNTTTGEPIQIPYVSHSGTRAEKWCRVCQEWVPVGVCLVAGLMGFIVCPKCHTDWKVGG